MIADTHDGLNLLQRKADDNEKPGSSLFNYPGKRYLGAALSGFLIQLIKYQNLLPDNLAEICS